MLVVTKIMNIWMPVIKFKQMKTLDREHIFGTNGIVKIRMIEDGHTMGMVGAVHMVLDNFRLLLVFVTPVHQRFGIESRRVNGMMAGNLLARNQHEIGSLVFR